MTRAPAFFADALPAPRPARFTPPSTASFASASSRPRPSTRLSTHSRRPPSTSRSTLTASGSRSSEQPSFRSSGLASLHPGRSLEGLSAVWHGTASLRVECGCGRARLWMGCLRDRWTVSWVVRASASLSAQAHSRSPPTFSAPLCCAARESAPGLSSAGLCSPY